MLFDIFNIFPYYLHVNYWTGKSVRIFSRKQVISGNFRRYDVYSWVWGLFEFRVSAVAKVAKKTDFNTTKAIQHGKMIRFDVIYMLK